MTCTRQQCTLICAFARRSWTNNAIHAGRSWVCWSNLGAHWPVYKVYTQRTYNILLTCWLLGGRQQLVSVGSGGRSNLWHPCLVDTSKLLRIYQCGVPTNGMATGQTPITAKYEYKRYADRQRKQTELSRFSASPSQKGWRRGEYACPQIHLLLLCDAAGCVVSMDNILLGIRNGLCSKVADRPYFELSSSSERITNLVVWGASMVPFKLSHVVYKKS